MKIAVDGPAASGKGTLAKRIAAHYGLAHLDTGLLYRATARDVLKRGGQLENVENAFEAASQLDPESLDDEGLRGGEIGDAASVVARIPEVRKALFEFQRNFCEQPGGAVLDGRDIGTVVCPDADVKLFIQAETKVRANRRFLELQARGIECDEGQVFEDLRARDERDSSRSASPLKPASDAVLLDTTNLDIEASYEAAIDLIEAALRRGGRNT